MDEALWKLALLPLLGALIGWATNAIAVRMIFKPHRPVNLLGLRVQGLVPKRQRELAVSIGNAVEKHLVSHEDIQMILSSGPTRAMIDKTVRERIHNFLEQGLGKMNPMVGMFLTGSMKGKIEERLVAEVGELVPELTDRLMTRMEADLNFQALVEEKIREFETDRLERIVVEIAARELKAIEVIGGVLGFTIGCVQVAIMLL